VDRQARQGRFAGRLRTEDVMRQERYAQLAEEEEEEGRWWWWRSMKGRLESRVGVDKANAAGREKPEMQGRARDADVGTGSSSSSSSGQRCVWKGRRQPRGG
jgi:hypothetical protein